MMAIASSIEGSSIRTFWKRLSSAWSFSMNLEYSSSVVAPITWSSFFVRSGFMMFAASMDPPVDSPAPTSVWISSIKRMTFGSATASSSMLLMRSSNSPLYLEPATIEPISMLYTTLPLITSGTLFSAIFSARPSAIAVLPTPGSPTRQGLFFVRRIRICITREISSSRPITGSILPCFASSVRFLPYLSSVLWPDLPPFFAGVLLDSEDASPMGMSESSFPPSIKELLSCLAASTWSLNTLMIVLLIPSRSHPAASRALNISG